MGKADVNVNIWLSEKKRFANLFNGVIYGGRQVILSGGFGRSKSRFICQRKKSGGKTKNIKNTAILL